MVGESASSEQRPVRLARAGIRAPTILPDSVMRLAAAPSGRRTARTTTPGISRRERTTSSPSTGATRR